MLCGIRASLMSSPNSLPRASPTRASYPRRCARRCPLMAEQDAPQQARRSCRAGAMESASLQEALRLLALQPGARGQPPPRARARAGV